MVLGRHLICRNHPINKTRAYVLSTPRTPLARKIVWQFAGMVFYVAIYSLPAESKHTRSNCVHFTTKGISLLQEFYERRKLVCDSVVKRCVTSVVCGVNLSLISQELCANRRHGVPMYSSSVLMYSPHSEPLTSPFSLSHFERQ